MRNPRRVSGTGGGALHLQPKDGAASGRARLRTGAPLFAGSPVDGGRGEEFSPKVLRNAKENPTYRQPHLPNLALMASVRAGGEIAEGRGDGAGNDLKFSIAVIAPLAQRPKRG